MMFIVIMFIAIMFIVIMFIVMMFIVMMFIVMMFIVIMFIVIMFIVMSKNHVHLLGEFAKFEKRLLASSCLSVRPSAWNHEIGHLSIFRKYVEKIHIPSKSNKNNK